MCRHGRRRPGTRRLYRFDTGRLVLNRLIHMLIIVLGAVTRDLFGLVLPFSLQLR